jgi:tRNA G18 (ribose-2'-O)-methylase SpoU
MDGRRDAQYLKALARRRSVRRQEQRFIIDGPGLVADALQSGVALEAVYVEAGTNEPVVDDVAAAGVRVHVVPPGSVHRFTDVVTPQGIAMLKEKMPHSDFSSFESDPKLDNMSKLFTVNAIVNYVQQKLEQPQAA